MRRLRQHVTACRYFTRAAISQVIETAGDGLGLCRRMGRRTNRAISDDHRSTANTNTLLTKIDSQESGCSVADTTGELAQMLIARWGRCPRLGRKARTAADLSQTVGWGTGVYLRRLLSACRMSSRDEDDDVIYIFRTLYEHGRPTPAAAVPFASGDCGKRKTARLNQEGHIVSFFPSSLSSERFSQIGGDDASRR